MVRQNLLTDHGCRLRDFGIKREKKQKNMLEMMVYKAGMTWKFGGISGRRTSQRIYGRNISST
jgi:hypothetical protein